MTHDSDNRYSATGGGKGMFDVLGLFKGIEELAEWSRKNSHSQSEAQKRASVKIAVVDDQAFSAQQNLKFAGYNVEEVGDVKSISELEKFPIILCDLHGVGSYFNSKYQGGFIIDEIKKLYPDKFVIAYTGGSTDPSVVAYAQDVADGFVKKDVDINEWRDTLDALIDGLCDPVEVWNRQRDTLIDRDVPTKEILRLEDKYVRAVIGRSPSGYVRFVSQGSVNPDVRAVGQSLVASGVFKLLFG